MHVVTRSAAAIGAAAIAAVSLLSQPVAGEPQRGKFRDAGWRDDFNAAVLDASRWTNVSGYAPGYRPGVHRGYYDPAHVDVREGMLVIELSQAYGQVDGSLGVISTGGLVASRDTYGYGTYQWRMRMSSTATEPHGFGTPVSGTVSAGFNYVNNSKTEIDFEFTGTDPDHLYMSNWLNTRPRRDPTAQQQTWTSVALPDMTSTFKTYTFVWERNRIRFYVDGALHAVHTTNIGKSPAYFMTNHWGSDSPWWGGAATVGTRRYAYVDWVQYTPPTG